MFIVKASKSQDTHLMLKVVAGCRMEGQASGFSWVSSFPFMDVPVPQAARYINLIRCGHPGNVADIVTELFSYVERKGFGF